MAPRFECEIYILCITMSLILFQRLSLSGVLTVYAPQAHDNAQHAGQQSDIVSSLVAHQSQLAITIAIRFDDGVGVVHSAIEQIVHIATDDRRPGEEPPVDGEAVGPERIDDDCRQDAESDAVSETAEAGDDPEIVWVLDAGGAQLVDGEYGG